MFDGKNLVNMKKTVTLYHPYSQYLKLKQGHIFYFNVYTNIFYC